jgi:hypothetical protein
MLYRISICILFCFLFVSCALHNSARLLKKIDSNDIDYIWMRYFSEISQREKYTITLTDSVFNVNDRLKHLIDSVILVAKKTKFYNDSKVQKIDSFKTHNILVGIRIGNRLCYLSPYWKDVYFAGKHGESVFSIGRDMGIGEYAKIKYYSDSLLSMKVIDLANEMIRYENSNHQMDTAFKKIELLSYSNKMFTLK